jgi:predicted ATPase/ATP/maltotriose-dependent transcriptional regulator MalT
MADPMGPRVSMAVSQLQQDLPKAESGWKIPVALTSFVGRTHDIAAICALLQRPEVRLLTILGIGGIGKTRLGMQVATALQEHFVDGVSFISLASVHDPHLVASTIAQGLGVQEVGEPHVLEQLKVVLQSKQLLLFIDNFEHVVTAASLLTELLLACMQLTILVTSRAVLYLQGEYQYPISPLPVPDSTHFAELGILAQNPAVSLFVQRAQAVRPHFSLTQTNAPIIAQICARLDGLPLAIELAASRIKMFPLQALLARLKRRFEILTGGTQGAPARQQTLHNAIAWSYDLLDPWEQRLFCMLSVFADGWTVEAIDAVVSSIAQTEKDSYSLFDRISSLLDKSLLLQFEQEGVDARFAMLETLREYGRERLQERGEAEMVQQAHALHFLRFAEQAAPYLKGEQQLVWVARIEQELENVRIALEWFIHRAQMEHALRLGAALGWFWYLRGYWSEGRSWLDAMLELADGKKPVDAYADVLYYAGVLAYYQDDSSAQALLTQSVALCREVGLTRVLVSALGMLGLLISMQGDRTSASPLLEECEHLCRTKAYRWELAHLLRKLALIAWHQGDLTRASSCAQEGLTLARKIGDTSLIATTLSVLSGIANRQGDLARATTLTQETLNLAQKLGDTSLIATATQNLGYLALQQNQFPQAAAYARRALTLFRELGDKTFITAALHSLGHLALLQNDLMQAAEAFQEGFTLSEDLKNMTRMGWHLVGLAAVAEKEGHYQKACRLLGVAEARLDVNLHMNAAERADYDELVKRVRTHLGEDLFSSLWAQGKAMTPQEALDAQDVVLSSSAVVKQEAVEDKLADLTARETEILRLVAQGLTDAQVAEKLVISTRTVSWHLSTIYGKLAVPSRSAATRFAIEHHLL